MKQTTRAKVPAKKLVVVRDEPHKLSSIVLRRSGLVEIYNGLGTMVDRLQTSDDADDRLTFECSLWRVLAMADAETRFYLETEKTNYFHQSDIQEFALEASLKDEYLLIRTVNSAATSERCFYMRLDGRTLAYMMTLADRARSVFEAPERAAAITFGEYYPEMDGSGGGNHSFGYARKGFAGVARGQQVGIDRTAAAFPMLEYKRPLIEDDDLKKRVLIASRRSLWIDAETNGFRFRVNDDVSEPVSFRLLEQLWAEYKTKFPASDALKKAADEKIFEVVSAIGRAKKMLEGKRSRTIRLPERAVMKVKYFYSDHPIRNKRKLNIEAKVFAGAEKNAAEIHAYEFNFDRTGNQIVNCRNPFLGFAAY